MTDEIKLRQIAAAMIMDCYFGTFEQISDNVDAITNQIMKAIDDLKIEYEVHDIQHAVIDSIAIALRMKRGIKEWNGLA